MTAIKPPVFVREMSSGLRVTREVREIETASRIHLAWPGRGKAWRNAAEVLSEALRGQASPQEARKAFVAAAKEEGVLIERELTPFANLAASASPPFWFPSRLREAAFMPARPALTQI